MKRTLTLMWLMLLAMPSMAQEAGLRLLFTNSAAIITNYVGSGTVLTIPDRITNYVGPGGVMQTFPNGIPITGIADYAFQYKQSLTKVVIGDTMGSIGAQAFYRCDSLVEASLGRNVTNIDDSAFLYCTKLTGITVDAANPSFSTPGGVLYDKTQEKLVTFPAGLGGAYAVPTSVKTFGDSAFAYSAVNQVTVGDGITNLGGMVFYSCASLTNLMLGKNLVGIEINPLQGCYRLESITVDEGNPAYSTVDGVLFDKLRTKLIKFPAGRGGTYKIPDSVTQIAFQGFYGSPNITSVTIPASVTNIGYNAFALSQNLATVYFGGDAPPDDGFGFYLNAKTTVYYLPGTTGWGPRFGSAPTAVWNLHIQSARFLGGEYEFTIAGDAYLTAVVEASPTLAPGVWSPVSTNTLAFVGLSSFSDQGAEGLPIRFYRLAFP